LDKDFSRWIEVLNSIPQGSVLGPVMFVLFINDLPYCVKSKVYLFADDTKLFWEIASQNDQVQLKQDLNSLQEWQTKRLLRFHPQKYKMMTTKSRKNILFGEKKRSRSQKGHIP